MVVDDSPHSSRPVLGGDLEDGRDTYLLHLLTAATIYRDRELDRRFEPLGLTVQKYRALMAIGRFPGCTMKELARFTFIDRTTLTRMIDQLVAAGRVTRVHAERDRRQVVLGLTPEGVQVGLEAVARLMATNREAAAGVSPAGIEAAIGVLEAVLANLIPDPDQLKLVFTMRRPDDA
jgi:DNA-binding MarR family transcriptional regulator